MDHSAEIDEAIGRLASAEYPAAVEALLAFGEPALHRLLQVSDGSVRPAFGDQYPARDTADNLVFALTVVGERHLDAFLLAVRQGQRLSKVSVVWALGQVDDPRVVEPLLVALAGSDRFAR